MSKKIKLTLTYIFNTYETIFFNIDRYIHSRKYNTQQREQETKYRKKEI